MLYLKCWTAICGPYIISLLVNMLITLFDGPPHSGKPLTIWASSCSFIKGRWSFNGETTKTYEERKTFENLPFGFVLRRRGNFRLEDRRTRCRRSQYHPDRLMKDESLDWKRIRDRNWRPTGPFQPTMNGCGGGMKEPTARTSFSWSIQVVRTVTHWPLLIRSIPGVFRVGEPPVRDIVAPDPQSCRTTRPNSKSNLHVPSTGVGAVAPIPFSSPSASRSTDDGTTTKQLASI